MWAITRALVLCAALGVAALAGSTANCVPKETRTLHLLQKFNALGVAYGQSVLLWASKSGYGDVARFFLVTGLNPNVADAQGMTPLMAAAQAGNIELMDSLLLRGANGDMADSNGRRALHYAIAAKKPAAVERLMGAEVRLDGKPDILGMAVDTLDWAIIQPVLSQLPVRTWDTAGRSALKLALSEKNVARMHLVMSHHSGPVAPEGCKVPLLAYAVVANDVDLARLLLEAGADPNTLVGTGAEPRFLDYVPYKFLKQYLAEEPGMTVLTVAAGMGHETMLRLLLSSGAERNRATKSKYRLIPLYFAAWGGHAECIQALIGNAPTPEEVRIEISLTAQRATLYKKGAAIYSTEISSGKPGTPSPTGRFVVTDKKTFHISNLYHAKMPFFMRLSCKDFGMHEGELPGYPASHGCIRLPGDSARKLFREVPIGTLVTIR